MQYYVFYQQFPLPQVSIGKQPKLKLNATAL